LFPRAAIGRTACQIRSPGFCLSAGHRFYCAAAYAPPNVVAIIGSMKFVFRQRIDRCERAPDPHPFEQAGQSFDFTRRNSKRAKAHIAKTLLGGQARAVLPMWIGRNAHMADGAPGRRWISVAELIEMAPSALEGRNLYTMFNLRQVRTDCCRLAPRPLWARWEQVVRSVEKMLGIR